VRADAAASRVLSRVLIAVLVMAVTGPAVAAEEQRVWLGVWLGDAIDGGIHVVGVVPGGPAAEAGIEVGDIILEARERAVPAQQDLGRVLAAERVGDTLPLVLLRAGDRVAVSVRLGSRPSQPVSRLELLAPPVAPPAPRPGPLHLESSVTRAGAAGIRVAEAPPALLRHYGASDGSGVLVVHVDPASPAARAGILVGDVVVRVDGDAIEGVDKFEHRLLRWSDTRSPLRADVVRDGKPVSITLRVPRAPEASPEAAIPAPGAAPAPPAPDAVELGLEREIRRLERRIDQLRRELERRRSER